jgi:hypothetical protein
MTALAWREKFDDPQDGHQRCVGGGNEGREESQNRTRRTRAIAAETAILWRILGLTDWQTRRVRPFSARRVNYLG